jgi:hypothetical protein
MTELMRRRRALMAAQGGADQSLKIGDLETASEVKLGSTSTVIYIYCGKLGGNALLLRKNCISGSNVKFRTSGNPDYEGSNLDTYLLNTIYPTYSDLAKSKMVDTTITITVGDGAATSTKNISRKIFAPTDSQMGNSGSITTVLKKYFNTTGSNASRVATDDGGTARGYWSSGAATATNVRVITSTGSSSSGGVNVTSYYVRPCLTLDPNAKVALDNGVYVLQEG